MNPSHLFNLHNKTALVTGSSGGLGLAMARGLAEAGAAVVLNGRSEAKLSEAVKSLTDLGHKASAKAFDVTNESQAEAAFLCLDNEGVAVDILVNNAGIQFRKPMLELALADWQRVIDANLTSAFLVGREAAQRMVTRGSGKVINIGSVMSEVARPTIAPYAASKGGIKMLTRAMAAEWTKFNIQTNAIGPGYIATEMNQALVSDNKFDAWVKGRTPAARWGDPKDIVGAAIFFSSSASDFISGQMLYVDGGMLAVL